MVNNQLIEHASHCYWKSNLDFFYICTDDLLLMFYFSKFLFHIIIWPLLCTQVAKLFTIFCICLVLLVSINLQTYSIYIQWTRLNNEKTQLFAEHVESVFALFGNQNYEEINNYLDVPCQLSPPVRSVSPSEVREIIKTANSHKAPDYDLIVDEILKHLPGKTIVLLTTLFNRMLHLSYFPIQFSPINLVLKKITPLSSNAVE